MRVKATDTSHIVAIAGAVAGGSTNGIGASLVNADIVSTTDAFIDGRATVSAATSIAGPTFQDLSGRTVRGVGIEAYSDELVAIVAIGGGGGGTTGVFGSFTVTVVDDTTQAYVTAPGVNPPAGAGITSGADVTIAAVRDFLVVGAAGALAVGVEGGAVGVGADVGVVTLRTYATVGAGAHITAARHVFIDAHQIEQVVSVSVSGAFSGTGAGAVTAAVSVVTLITRASIGADAVISAGGNVIVTAFDRTTADLVTANVSGSGTFSGGLAGGVSVLDKTTEAAIAGGAHVTALGGFGASTAYTGGFTSGADQTDKQKVQPAFTFTTDAAHPDTDIIDAPGHTFLGGEVVVYVPAGLPIPGSTSGAATTSCTSIPTTSP